MKILDRCKQITDTESGRVLLYRDEVEAVLTAGDTISRKAAVDALRYAQHRFTVADEAGGMGTVKWSEDVIYFAAAERVLTELPSAQPTQLNTPNTLETLDYISRAAAIDVLEKIPVREFKKSDGLLDALVSIGQVYMALKQLPSVQPTIYGYKIEHLAYIARVMEKEGVTADYAVRTFDDMGRAIKMIIDEAQQKAEEMLNERFNQQTGCD